jgi:hypothetical protein
MKLFLTRLFSFTGLVIILNLILNLAFPIQYKDSYSIRKQYLFDAHHIASRNVLFFGTSRTRNHINPADFDAENRLDKCQTSSFNMGLPASNLAETSYLYEKFLEQYSSLPKGERKLRYVLFEFHEFGPVSLKNLTAEKSFYWVDLKNLSFAVDYTLATYLKSHQKLQMISGYVTSFLLRTLGFNYINIRHDEDLNLRSALGKGGRGFVSREEAEGKSLRVKEARDEFLADTTRLIKRMELAEHDFRDPSFSRYRNQPNVDRLLDLIKKSKAQGIDLIFIVQPRLGDYKEILGTLGALPPKHAIVIANPKQYQGLWAVRNSSDIGHLNIKGAKLFNRYLSDEFVRLVQPETKTH